MGRTDFGNTASLISQVTDKNQLQRMLQDPRYAGFTSVIIARMTEINHMEQAAAGAQPEAPTVAQQAMSGQVVPEQQAMARGGIVAFRHGGEVRGFKEGGKPRHEMGDYTQQAIDSAAQSIEGERSPLLKAARGAAGVANIGLAGVADIVDPYARALRYGVTGTPYDASFDNPTQPTAPAATQPAEAKPATYTPTPLPPLAPVTEKELGLPSLGGSGGYRVASGGGKTKTMTEYYNELRGLYDKGKPAAKTPEELAREARLLELRQQAAAWDAMGQSANANPHLGILGHGIAGNSASRAFAEKERADADAERKAQEKLAQLDRKNIADAAAREYAADARNDRAVAAQYAGINAQLKAPALLEQRIRRLAIANMNADRAKNIQRPFEQYEAEAWAVYNTGLRTQELRGATAERIATQAGWNRYQDRNGPVDFERYAGLVSSGVIQDGGDTGGQILGVHPGAQ